MIVPIVMKTALSHFLTCFRYETLAREVFAVANEARVRELGVKASGGRDREVKVKEDRVKEDRVKEVKEDKDVLKGNR